MTPKTINEIISVSIGAACSLFLLVMYTEFTGDLPIFYFVLAYISSFAAGVFMYNFFKRGG